MPEKATKVIRVTENAYNELCEAAKERDMRPSDLASRLIRSGIVSLPPAPKPDPLAIPGGALT